MKLTLEQCTIRPWRLDDADSLARHANNRKVRIALRDLFPHPYTIEDAHAFLKSVINSEPVTLFCIETNGAAVGGIGIRIGADVHRQTAELGYWLSEEFWGARHYDRSCRSLHRFLLPKISAAAEFMQSRSRITAHRRACWKKPASLSKDASRTTFSKMGSFSIHFCTLGQSRVAHASSLRISPTQAIWLGPATQ